MSSGRTSEDGNTVSFECNLKRKIVRFTLTRLPADRCNEDRIILKMVTQDVSDTDAQYTVDHSMVLNKSSTMILSHYYRHMSNVMDDWYGKDTISIGGKQKKWVPGHYEDIPE